MQRESESPGVSSSFYKDNTHIGLRPHPWDLTYLLPSFRPYLQVWSHEVLGLQQMNFGGAQFSPYQADIY